MKVICVRPEGRGWDPVDLFAALAADLLDATLVVRVADRIPSRARQVGALLPRRRDKEPCLLVAAQPGHLQTMAEVATWRHSYSEVAAYVIDSFWDDRIPFVARSRHLIDQYFVTDGELVPSWQRTTGTPTAFLPFGADVLRRGSAAADRPVDVQRMGRQPETWDDDAEAGAAAARLGLVHRGRPPFVDGDADANQRSVMAAMAAAKYTLSFSNLASPAPYTHLTREYLTGRWTDALASGAVVAGIAPRCAAAEAVLWPEATLDLGTTDRERGLAVLREAAQSWTPAQAQLNHARALERVDWRWRLQQVASTMGWHAPRLEAELDELRRRVSALTAA
jgi:hypothetical protein